ncbi:MAG: SpoIIIAC/SpoIIIAD family protein [Eubacteriales bacterium]|nr:SpoIIIAC/SpoIIIAD family protein [Eubacteriales bacterium]
MDMIKIAVLGIIGILLSLFVKEWKPQFSVLISISVCVLICYYAIARLYAVAEAVSGLTRSITVKEAWMSILLKIVGISYLADFTSNICKDAGYSAIASQIEIFGKISILTVSTPIVLALLQTISSFLG